MPSTGQEEFQWMGLASYGVHWLGATESYTGAFWSFIVVETAQISGLNGSTTGTYTGKDLSAGQQIPTPDASAITCDSGTIILLLAKE